MQKGKPTWTSTSKLQAELEGVTAERDGLIRVCEVLFAAIPPPDTGRRPE